MADPTVANSGHRKPVWLDCDPGHDDAMAIMLAGWSPALKLLGISTVASNQVVEKTTRNALDVLDLCGLEHIGRYTACRSMVPVVHQQLRIALGWTHVCTAKALRTCAGQQEVLPQMPDPCIEMLAVQQLAMSIYVNAPSQSAVLVQVL